MAGRFLWRGRATGGRYEFDQYRIPAALLSANGQPINGTYNGETCIFANDDGAVPHDLKTGPPAGTTGLGIYDAYVAFSTWSETLS
ncbi:MAG: hypothetical protein ACLQGJ_10275 [Candidatus Dormibacteria bacterium]